MTNAELTDRVKALETENKALVSDNTNKARQIETLEIQLQEEQEAHELTQVEAARMIDELKAKVAGKKAPAKVAELDVDGVAYHFSGGDFTYKGNVVSLAILQDNPALAAELIEEGFACLQPVV